MAIRALAFAAEPWHRRFDRMRREDLEEAVDEDEEEANGDDIEALIDVGEAEGIISPETADHAAGTSALLPMLSLGIPGSATAAVMMGGLMIWGLNPGPMPGPAKALSVRR